MPGEQGTDKGTPKEQARNTNKNNKKEELIRPNCPPATSDRQDFQAPKRPVGKKTPEYAEDSPPYKLAKYLWKLITENFPKTKPPDLQKWARSIDLMIRIDKRNPDDIGWVIAWAQKDSFWRSNILSTEKLRKQFDTIQARMGGLK